MPKVATSEIWIGKCNRCPADGVPVIDVLGDASVFLCAQCLELLLNLMNGED